MNETGEKLSLIDLIEYYEPGPVLRERTPDLNRTSFYPDEAQHFESDEAPDPGKNITRKAELDLIRKKALGLTDVPSGAPSGGAGHFGVRDSATEEGPEEFAPWFGGLEDFSLDNFPKKEDKPPTNISRKLNTDKKIKTLGDLDKMSFQKSELLKLAKALRHRGQSHFANKVEGIALRKVANLDHRFKTKFEDYWGSYEVSSRLREASGDNASQAFFDSTKPVSLSPISAYMGSGTDPGLMLAACFYGPNKAKVNELFEEHEAGWFTMGERSSMIPGMGEVYSKMSLMDIVKAEEGDEFFQQMCQAMLEGRVNSKNFKPIEGKFIEAPETISGTQPRKRAPNQEVARDDGSTTQQRTWVDTQKKLNDLFTGDGVLAGNVENGKIKGTDVTIPLKEDADKWNNQTGLGPQTTGAFNAATGKDYEERNWPISPDEAYNMLLDIERKAKEGEAAKGGEDTDKPAEGTAEEADMATILRGARLNPVGNMDEWYTATADDGKTLVAIRKRDGQLAAMSVQRFDVVKNKDGGNTLKQSQNGQRVWTDMENRGEQNQVLFSAGDDYMSGGEIRSLMKVIRDAGVDKEQIKEYEDVMKGQKRSERGGLFNMRGVKRRGERRQTGAQERLRGRARARRK